MSTPALNAQEKKDVMVGDLLEILMNDQENSSSFGFVLIQKKNDDIILYNKDDDIFYQIQINLTPYIPQKKSEDSNGNVVFIEDTKGGGYLLLHTDCGKEFISHVNYLYCPHCGGLIKYPQGCTW